MHVNLPRGWVLRDQSCAQRPDLRAIARKPSSFSSYRHSRASGSLSIPWQSIGSNENGRDADTNDIIKQPRRWNQISGPLVIFKVGTP